MLKYFEDNSEYKISELDEEKDYDKTFIMVASVLGFIPFLRYIVMHNHSHWHNFFTYRALASTIFAIVLIIGEITEIPSLTREKKLK